MLKGIYMIKKSLYFIWIGVLLFILAVNLGLTGKKMIDKEGKSTVFGWTWAIVLSGSMAPAIEVDDLIIAKEQEHYNTGDIVIYGDTAFLTTHRIIEETAEGFITKGDANNARDMLPVPKEQIAGKVVYIIPWVGKVIGYLRSPLGMVSIVLMSLLLMAFPFVEEAAEKERGQYEKEKMV